MKKGKDPAFLFYPEKWITETYFMTHEEKGIYIDLLALQHNVGHLEPKMFYKVTAGVEYPNVLKLFKVDKKGNLYNEQLDLEIDRRKKYSEYQSERAKKRWEKKDAIAPTTADACESNSMRTITKTTTIASIPIESIESIDAKDNDPLQDLYVD